MFGKEEDNQHQEPLAVAQLAAGALRRLMTSLSPASSRGNRSGRSGLGEVVLSWLQRILPVRMTLKLRVNISRFVTLVLWVSS